MAMSSYKRKIQEFIKSTKVGSPCTDCKISYPFYAMQYDHVIGAKSFTVGRAKSIRLAEEEIAKCEIVCTNCHAIRTHKRTVRLPSGTNTRSRTGLEKLKSAIRAAKESLACLDCNLFYPSPAMEFDHITDDKIMKVSSCSNFSQAIKEIEKCELVCANCHATRTHTRRLEQIKNVV